MKKAVKKTKKTGGSGGEVADDRFTAVASDPKFIEMSNRNRKVTIDKRFHTALTDKKFSAKAAMDRRGRTVDLGIQDDLRNIYDVESSDDEAEKSEEPKKPKVMDLARGEGNVSSSDESDSDSEEEVEDEEDENWADLDNDVQRVEWASRRLAICNMDWDRITADDLFVLFSSFKPPTGTLVGLTVYLSDFGKERIELEEREGPQIKKTTSKDKEAATEAVRQYQLDRLKYYYAILECDSVETASSVYEECDGVEFEMSSVKMDLRFVPDDMIFEEDRVKERSNADNVNVNKYKPKYFESSALANCKAKITWDETDPDRKRAMREVFNAENVDDFKDLIAPGSSDEEDEAQPNTLETLLNAQGEDDDSGRKQLEVEWNPSLDMGAPAGEEEEEEEGMEMAFEEDETEGKKSNKTKDSKTPWEKYMEKRKAKKKERKAAIQAHRQAKREERDAENAEALEEHKKRLAAKKREEAAKNSSGAVDMNDDRFSALFTNSAFAIDRSNPLYKSAQNLADVQVLEKKKRKIESKEDADTPMEEKAQKGPNTSSLVAKLKKRTETLKNKKRKLN